MDDNNVPFSQLADKLAWGTTTQQAISSAGGANTAPPDYNATERSPRAIGIDQPARTIPQFEKSERHPHRHWLQEHRDAVRVRGWTAVGQISSTLAEVFAPTPGGNASPHLA